VRSELDLALLRAASGKETNALKFILGLIAGVLLIAIAVDLYFTSGRAPVATSDKPMPFEAKLAKRALHARLDREMPKTVPIAADESAYLAGARVYREHCAVCHGVPGTEQSAIAQGMFPKPPRLFRGKGVTDDPPGETYWKVAHGIRLTGMPAFQQSLTDTQMWQVSLLLAMPTKSPTRRSRSSTRRQCRRR
jgi:mono/diheme cytochrome c family protein